MDLIREVRNHNLPGVLQLLRAGADVNYVQTSRLEIPTPTTRLSQKFRYHTWQQN